MALQALCDKQGASVAEPAEPKKQLMFQIVAFSYIILLTRSNKQSIFKKNK
ncbi:MAG: hypothetical protein V4495_03280 [Pseudomonadota bacterium]